MPNSPHRPLPHVVRFLSVLGPAYILSQFLRSANAVIAPELINDLGLSASQLGALTGAYFLAFALVQLPVGVMLDRIGPRRVMAAMIVFAAAGAFLFSKSTSLTGLIAARALMGLGTASILMGGFVIFARWYPKSRFSLFAGAMLGIGNTGILLASFPLGWAVEQVGWRTSFELTAFAAVLLALAVVVMLRDAPDDHPHHPKRRPPGESFADSARGFKIILRERRLWQLYPLMFVGYASIAAISTLWAGPYLADVHGLDVLGRGKVMFLMGGGSVAGSFFYAPLDRLFNTRKGVVMGGVVTGISLLIVLALWGSASLALSAVVLALLALATGYATVLTAHSRTLYPDHLVGRGIALGNMFNMMGVAVVQWATGVVMDALSALNVATVSRYSLVFLLLALLLAAALFIYARVSDAPPHEGASPAAK